ncbi:MAG: UDP-N-acetylmuramoyl-L-alanyl-D-glutamate--2,6-diaminopimelate ligase [Bacilli bacterium]
MKYVIDSRKVKEGQIFVAIKGHTVDGHDYIEDAIKNGAIEIVAEKEIKASVPVLVVPSTDEYLKNHLKDEYSDILNEMKFIGVTGTNGKTTTCFLTYQLLKAFNVKVAYMGTIGFYYDDLITNVENTTPDILTIYSLLIDAKNKGCTTVVMEVSSHSLSYERIFGLHLDIAGFTNLTEDHLDYHKTMEAYLNEKLKIINYLTNDGTLIVNSDDDASNKFTEKFSNHLSVGLNGDYKIIDFKITPAKTNINFSFKNKTYSVTTNLTSKFNVYNYLTSLALVNTLGYEIHDIIEKTSDVKAPKGRCETYPVNNGFAVVDFAHTPDAVEKVIDAYNELKENRVITIIGCGGDRDPIKRPIMGRIAAEKSDYVIFSSDNPRTEDPKVIMEDILKGVKTNNYEVELDRTTAIKKGIDMMEENDILLILGKGHENYQIIGRTKIHLDDAEQVLNWKK